MKNDQPIYLNEDGAEFNPNLIPKPDLCISCRKDGLAEEEILCNLTRADQHGEDQFCCEAFEPKG